MRRVAHKAGNTGDVLDAAMQAGVDMLEFDVLPERPDGTGELFLAHDYGDLAERRATVMTLAEGLTKVCATGLDLNVDLKLPGYEDRVVEALHGRGYADRSLVSSMETVTLERIRALDPSIQLGWSVPKIRHNPFASPLTMVPGYLGLQVLKRVLPGRVAAALREGRCDAIMANHHLVTPALAKAIIDAGGELYVWTVDDRVRIDRLRELGVTGVISNDPRLFAAA